MLVLFACVLPDDSTGAKDSAPGTGGDMPAYCADVSSTPVATTDIAPGFTFSVSDALAVEVGDFVGTLTPYSGDPSPLSLSLALDSSVAPLAVTRELVDPAGDTGYAMGAPSVSDCPAVYRYTLDGTLGSDDGRYGGPVTVAMEVADPATDGFAATMAWSDFTGTASPSFDVASYDRVELGIAGTPAWTGSLMWYGLNDAARTTGSGSSDSGSVGVSGETEGIGSFSLAPV